MKPEEDLPTGCPGCNPDSVLPLLEARGIHVEEIPPPTQMSSDVIVCDTCGRAWLMMPRPGDPGVPVA
jgi:DNA-directed RNA polymerase subunit RPC12/RpoP